MRKLAIAMALAAVLVGCGYSNTAGIDQMTVECVNNDLEFDALGWDSDGSINEDIRVPTVVRNHPVCQVEARPTPFVSD